jgi:hypothetical protein
MGKTVKLGILRVSIASKAAASMLSGSTSLRNFNPYSGRLLDFAALFFGE